MTDKLREQSIEFAKKHLFECAKEILDWGRTSILCDGKLRELAKTCEAWVRDESYALGVAEAIVKEEALRAALAQQDAQQDVDWEKLYRLEVKKKEALAAKYERDIKPLTKIVPLAQPVQQDAQAVSQGYRLVSGKLLADAVTEKSTEIENLLGSYNREMTKCHGCGVVEDGWMDGDLITHKSDCAWVAQQKAIAEIRAMLNAAPTPPAQRVMLTDGELLERLASASPEQLDAWLAAARQSEARKQRVMLTDEELYACGKGLVWPLDEDSNNYARAVIEAYEKKNGISQPGYTATDMASQGASQFRAGHDAAQSEIAELEQENRLPRARNDRLQKEIEQKGER